jgi:hypothetical protein
VDHPAIFFVEVLRTERVGQCRDGSEFLCHGLGDSLGRGHGGGKKGGRNIVTDRLADTNP